MPPIRRKQQCVGGYRDRRASYFGLRAEASFTDTGSSSPEPTSYRWAIRSKAARISRCFSSVCRSTSAEVRTVPPSNPRQSASAEGSACENEIVRTSMSSSPWSRSRLANSRSSENRKIGGPTGMSCGELAPASATASYEHAEKARPVWKVPDRKREAAVGVQNARALGGRTLGAADVQQDVVRKRASATRVPRGAA
jgi:hypothetical protein